VGSRLAGTLLALFLLVSCTSVEPPVVVVTPPIVKDDVALVLHIETRDKGTVDLVAVDNNGKAITRIRTFCEAFISGEVLKIINIMNLNGVALLDVQGYCFTEEELQNHTKTHAKPIKGKDIPDQSCKGQEI
jgi:hypothetical protein